MNKREFLSRGGVGVLASSSAFTLAGMAQSQAHTPHQDATNATRNSAFDSWRERTGETFETHTALGRSVTLTLASVSALSAKGGASQTSPGLSQFDLAFEGARHLPLQEGLHTLVSANHGPLALHLQPHRQGDGMRYIAHFSLLA
ncbi:MAG: hypothetical protein I8H76_08445 [Burkholderiales bacterium]|nr:hypothetical protein [Burkholderiales bacterium]MBH2015953.1 hypothetical protein [Burkholderiales bacterium]